jgi:hypothetical protein
MRIHGQKGLSLSGFLVWAVLFIIVALIGFKVGPPYMEFLTIQAQLKAISNDPEGRTGVRRVVEDLFDRRTAIENITSVKPKDLQITKDGDRAVISAEYTVCVPLILNIRVCMDYAPTSAK